MVVGPAGGCGLRLHPVAVHVVGVLDHRPVQLRDLGQAVFEVPDDSEEVGVRGRKHHRAGLVLGDRDEEEGVRCGAGQGEVGMRSRAVRRRDRGAHLGRDGCEEKCGDKGAGDEPSERASTRPGQLHLEAVVRQSEEAGDRDVFVDVGPVRWKRIDDERRGHLVSILPCGMHPSFGVDYRASRAGGRGRGPGAGPRHPPGYRAPSFPGCCARAAPGRGARPPSP